MSKKPTVADLIVRRHNLRELILKRLSHLTEEQRMNVIFSWIPMANLEEMAITNSYGFRDERQADASWQDKLQKQLDEDQQAKLEGK